MTITLTLSKDNRIESIDARIKKDTLKCHTMIDGILTELEIVETDAWFNRVVVNKENLPIAKASVKIIGIEAKLFMNCNETLIFTVEEC